MTNNLEKLRVPGTLRALRYLVPFALAFFFLSSSVQAGTYRENLGDGLKRGVKNIFSSPAEILISVQDYHERSGWPFVRQMAGGVVGAGKMILRLGSGIVDLGAAWIPGIQQGIPLNPEVLF